MSENKQTTETKAATPADAPAAKPAKEVKNGAVKAAKVEQKREKQKWTLQRCQKAARRFATEAEWKVGAPSSWKSATAHEWVADCVSQMKKKKKSAPEKKVA